MIIDRFDAKPVQLLLARHREHQESYLQDFRGIPLIIFPDVFNPAYTKVSSYLADNLVIQPGSTVLEMFSGSGALSFIAAGKAREVTGVDISPNSVDCAKLNAAKLGLSDRTKFRVANLWEGVREGEKFDVIIANPPLLPAIPESWLEMTIADSPDMLTTIKFIQGCSSHLTDSGRVFMAFSNACGVYFANPLGLINKTADESGLIMQVKSEWDVGYEIYRILEFTKK